MCPSSVNKLRRLWMCITIFRCVWAKKHGIHDTAWTLGSRHTVSCIPRLYWCNRKKVLLTVIIKKLHFTFWMLFLCIILLTVVFCIVVVSVMCRNLYLFVCFIDIVVTRRHSIARWIFSAVSVCVFDCTITSERLNLGWRNVAVRCIVQKYCPISNVKVKASKVKVTGTKNGKMLSHPHWQCMVRWCMCCRPYAACSSRRVHSVAAGGDGVTAVHVDVGLHAVLSRAVLIGSAMLVGRSAHAV